jgi:hypothetical protein
MVVLNPSDKKNFMIDIDGVLCPHVDNEQLEQMRTVEPYPEAVEWVNKLFEEGHYICFFTARTEEHRQITEEWLNKHGFKYHQIIFNKPRGGNYHYIDDRTVRATRYEGKLGRFVRKLKEIEVFE